MASTLNKSALNQKNKQLKLYKRFLPTLEMKRQQLLVEKAREATQIEKLIADYEALSGDIGEQIPMVGDRKLKLDGLIRLEKVDIGEQNVLGTRLPVLRDFDLVQQEYSWFAQPQWIDILVYKLKDLVRLRLQRQVAEERLRLLEIAVRKVTQRVNLFDKVLIPETQADIKKIKIYLADEERAGIVRAKLAKSRGQAEAA
ncbi:MAG: V-type ATP synthase subunit D [Alphaproteobacteria bacterium]|nr:V-type ATP synthase subunit D [Alphaproteobacteria bacterium]